MMNIINDILRREGSTFTDHPADKGGPTRWGVTQETLGVYLGRPATVDEVRNLTEAEARKVYQHLYIDKPGFGGIANHQLQHLLIDSGVQHGPVRASKWLQAAVNVRIDGDVGPQTLAAVNAYPWRVVYRSVFQARMKFYGRIITDNPSQAVWAAGWMNRLSEFVI
jgi:lysozyme family protein